MSRFRFRRPSSARRKPAVRAGFRRLGFEQLELRKLLSVNQQPTLDAMCKVPGERNAIGIERNLAVAVTQRHGDLRTACAAARDRRMRDALQAVEQPIEGLHRQRLRRRTRHCVRGT